MLATGLQPARALIAFVLAISTSLAFIGADLHVEMQGYCDSADDFMIYTGASSMEASSSAKSVSLSGSGLLALVSSGGRNLPVPYLVSVLDEMYSRRRSDGVKKLVDRPG